MAGCDHCPFRDDAETPCCVIAGGATHLCRKVDPSDPRHNPAMVDAVRRLTLEPLGRWPKPAPVVSDRAAIERRRAGKVRVALGVRVPPGRR